MANKDLFAQAIADAKKLKEISMANAKQAIEEAFAPRIQEMFRMKLSEMEDTLEEDEVEDIENADTELTEDDMDNMEEAETDAPTMEEDINEMTLEEILAELELEEGEIGKGHGYNDKFPFSNIAGTEKGWVGGEEDVKGTEGGSPYMEEAKKDDEDADDADDEDAEEAEEEVTGEETVAEVDLDTLVSKVADAVINALNAKEGGVENMEAGEEDMEGSEEAMPGDETTGGDETISLDEILAELQEEEILAEAKKKGKMVAKKVDMKKKEMKKDEKEEDEKEEKKKLKEAVDTIEVLKSELNEINLLNAKLLYVNKIFKSKSLSEAQKVKVITAFDRATTITETKNIYATLNDSLTSTQATKKAPLKESLGFASKPIGSAPARPIVEADAYVHRMQQLAGLRQPNI
jgi:hypothetical protein